MKLALIMKPANYAIAPHGGSRLLSGTGQDIQVRQHCSDA
jgi:hypothetical protein